MQKAEDSLAVQEELLAFVQEAENKYQEDEEMLLEAYEKVFLCPTPLRSNSRAMSLAKMYLKRNMVNKAWSFLNLAYAKKLMPVDKIRTMQADICKKEGRHKDAIKFYLFAYITYLHDVVSGHQQLIEQFQKKIRPCVKALGWGDEESGYLAYLLDYHYKNKRCSEASINQAYKNFLESK